MQTVKSNKKYLDCALHPIGQQQASSLAPQTLELELDLVFVSPLRRALETAHLIFKDYAAKRRSPDKKLKIVVLPELTESLCSADDASFKSRQE